MENKSNNTALNKIAAILEDTFDNYRITVSSLSLESLLILFTIIILFIYLYNKIYNNFNPRSIRLTSKLYNSDEDNYDKLIISELSYNLHKFFDNFNNLDQNNDITKPLYNDIMEIYESLIYKIELTDKNDLEIKRDEPVSIISGNIRTEDDKKKLKNKLNSYINGETTLETTNIKDVNLRDIQVIKDIITKDFLFISQLSPVKKIDDDDPIFDEDRNVLYATTITKKLYNSYIKPEVDNNEIILNNTVFLKKFINKDDISESNDDNIKIKLLQIKMDELLKKLTDTLKDYTMINTIDTFKSDITIDDENIKIYKNKHLSANNKTEVKENIINYIKIIFDIILNLQIYLLRLNDKYTLTSLLAFYKLDLLTNEEINNDTIHIIKKQFKYASYSYENNYKRLVKKLISDDINGIIDKKNITLQQENDKQYNTNILDLIKDFVVISYLFINLICITDTITTSKDVINNIEKISKNILNENIITSIGSVVSDDISFSINLTDIIQNQDLIINVDNYSNNILRRLVKFGNINNKLIKYNYFLIKDRNDIEYVSTNNKTFLYNQSKYIISNLSYFLENKIEANIKDFMSQTIDEYIKENQDNNVFNAYANKYNNTIKPKIIKNKQNLQALTKIYSSLLYFNLLRRFYNNNILEYSSLYNMSSNSNKLKDISWKKDLFNNIWLNSAYKYLWGRFIYLRGYINEFKPSEVFKDTSEPIEKPVKPVERDNVPILEYAEYIIEYQTALKKYEEDMKEYDKAMQNINLPEAGNTLYDEDIYFNAVIEKWLNDTMYGLFDEPGKTRKKPRKIRISVPWPFGSLGDFLSKIVNFGNMVIWLVQVFIDLMSDFNKLVQFIIKVLIFMILYFISVLHSMPIIGQLPVWHFIAIREILILVIYFFITFWLCIFYCIVALISWLVLSINNGAYYNFIYSGLLANEFNPRSFYRNVDYFKNFYEDFNSAEEYLANTIYESDLMNNDNISISGLLYKGINYDTFGDSAPYWELQAHVFCRKRETYLPSFNPDILIIRNYMKLMYKEMLDMDGSIFKSDNMIDYEYKALANDGIYNFKDNFSDTTEIINESYYNNTLYEKRERIKEIQKDKIDYINKWVKFKNDNNFYRSIYDIDINNLVNSMYLYSDISYPKLLNIDKTKLDDKNKLVENMRDVYSNMFWLYTNSIDNDIINNKVRLYYNKLIYKPESIFDYSSLSDHISKILKDEINTDNKLYNNYRNNDFLRNIVTKITYIFILLGINKIVYDII